MPDPLVEEEPMPVIAEERTSRVVETLFGNEPPAEEVKEEEVKEEEKEEVVVEEKDDDYEAPIAKKEVHESAAVKQAKEKGREAKRLAQENAELKLERDRLAEEKAERDARIAEIEAVNIKPTEHPDFVSLQSEVLDDVKMASRRLRGEAKVLFPRHFGEIMQEYLVSTEADDVVAADEKLNAFIVDKLKLSETPYEELTEEEKAEHRVAIDKVTDVMERNLGKTKALRDLHDKLATRAKNGHYVASVRDYEKSVSEFKPILDAVGELPDAALETDPHSIEAVVTRLVRESPDAAKRLASAKRDVLEVIVGPKALSQDDIDRLEANGTDVKAFLVERQKAFRDKQKKFAGMFVQALVTRGMFKEIHAEWSALKGSQEAEESEFDAIRTVTKKKAAPVEKQEKRTWDSPLKNLFGDEE